MTSNPTDLQLAHGLAHAAGQRLMALRADAALQGAALGAAGDHAANALLMDGLRRQRPGDAVLCEEEPDAATRLQCSRVWIVDPLDGTREYAERRDDWAVHVALAIDGQPVLGAVALPARGLVLDSASAPRPTLPLPPRPRLVVSRSRPPPQAAGVVQALGAELLTLGSAGAKAMAVVLGEADAYLHDGGQHEWDSCAPVAVALAAGLHCSRLDGTPLRYNQPRPYLPDLLICRRELAGPLLQALAPRP